ncbi:MAG: hypothetical protein U9R42_09000 [Bacteroidota bacterium]|nr:hypothetical protein [Bacteroidota bacterium]
MSIENPEILKVNPEIARPEDNLPVDPIMKNSEIRAYNIEVAKRKIADEQKIEELRANPGIENYDSQIHSFISELPNREGYVDFSQLQKCGHGGTHDVFIYPQNPKFVIKLNRGALEKALSVGQSTLPPEIQKMADQYIEGENNKNEQLYEHFGQKHCLREKAMIQKIRIEKDGNYQDITGVISIQEASDIFKDRNKKDFSTGYTEQDPELGKNKEIYDRMNKALLGKEEFNENDFLEFNDKLKSIFELVDSDKEFADCMRVFLLKFKNYFEASGRFIDLVGQENVLFYKEEGKWTFKLGSVVKVENKEVMTEAMQALAENPEGINQDERLRNQLMNQLALIRLLNASGLKVGIGKIVDIELTDEQLENLDKIKFSS